LQDSKRECCEKERDGNKAQAIRQQTNSTVQIQHKKELVEMNSFTPKIRYKAKLY